MAAGVGTPDLRAEAATGHPSRLLVTVAANLRRRRLPPRARICKSRDVGGVGTCGRKRYPSPAASTSSPVGNQHLMTLSELITIEGLQTGFELSDAAHQRRQIIGEAAPPESEIERLDALLSAYTREDPEV